MKTAVQLDFDGTVTVHDISYLLLDAYAGDAWHPHLRDYESGRINVGAFNRRSFALVTAGREEMTDFVLQSGRLVIREGFKEFIDYCRERGFPIMITSNGLRFYVEAILEHLGIAGLEIHASENEFSPDGMKVKYVGPDGSEMEDGFKEAWTRSLMAAGYQVVFVGNGTSDIHPARLARHVFAAEELLEKCRRENLACRPFRDFRDVLTVVETLDLA
jgi:2-hydroxy-3-keto-5-methylthiopentenyl-1-phosphate phosphatase